MARKRSNKPRRWWHDKRRVAKRLRAGLLLSALFVAVLAFVNIAYATSAKGPFGIDGSAWRIATFAIYALLLPFALGAVWWLKRNDELPKEK